MGSIVNLVAGFAAIVGGSARLVWPRRRPSPATRYMCGGVIAAGLSAALSAPAVLAAAAHVEPHPNVTRLLVNCIGMVAAWCAHSLLIHLVVDDAARARAAVRLQAVVLLVVITAMAALFLSAEMTYRPDFLDTFADVPEVYGYLLLFSGYVGWSMVRFVQLMGRYAGLTDRRWLQVGMRTMQIGAGLGVAWAVHKVVASTAVFLVGSSYPGSAFLASALPATCVTLIAVGICIPVGAPAVADLLLRAKRHRQYRSLATLWTTLSPVITQVRPVPATGRTIHEKLSARVVDILDALLILAPYRDGVNSDHTDAEQEAASITTALTRWTAGSDPVLDTVPEPACTMDDLDGEVAWLRRIARAMRRRPMPASDSTATN
ncbi:MAB_1171c family putative transporter [Saccharomonospora viridis]|uniref:MAB_1171c family putative transporter n=1 Tax=Saccharomonospora viridis TaxID=1852 RepID=UPI0023F05214|nr:MAB_1171c family putative transporter [Saccharomonospora viridis]